MREGERQVRVRNWVIGGAVLLGIVALLMLWNREAPFGGSGGPGEPGEPATVEAQPPAARPMPSPPDTTGGSSERPAAAQTLPPPSLSALPRSWTALLGRPPEWPDDLSSPRSCVAVDREMAAVCAELDTRPYLAPLGGMGGACGLLEEVANELAARPPSIGSELRSYEAIVGNVYHLFRVLGRERMSLLRRMMEEEQALVEPLAMTFYRWLVSREDCVDSGATPIRLSALYEYAGFLFNTMGGQAYMRRRQPRLEAMACFYGLQILHLAIEAGQNPHGIDPRPELRRCRAMIVSQPLALQGHYVAALDEISRRWEIEEP